MKWILGGKIYDTETAVLMHSVDPRWISTMDGGQLYQETKYYRTKKGAWFEIYRCPPAPTLWGWFITGGFYSDWRCFRLSEEAMTEIAEKYGITAKLGLKPPIAA
jgi:hypothetical protein